MKVTLTIVSIFIGIGFCYWFIPSEKQICEKEFGTKYTSAYADDARINRIREGECTKGVFVGLFFGVMSYIALINLAKSRGWE